MENENKKKTQTKSSEVEMSEEAIEKAVEIVAKKMGVSKKELDELEKLKTKKSEMVEYDIGSNVVHINGQPYTGRGRVKREIAEVLMHAAGSRRMRLLNEMVRNSYELQQLAGGGFSTKLVSQESVSE